MSLLCVVVSVLAANFADSARNSFDSYFTSCGIPDALVETLPQDKEDFSFIAEYEDIKEIDTRLVIESNMETKDEKQFSSRLITYDENGQYKLTIHSHKDIETELPKVSIFYGFADYNNIKVGDEITIYGSLGTIKCMVESTISTPETFNCVKDKFSDYENYQFCYIYMTKTALEKIASFSNKVNSVLIYFNDNVTLDNQKKTLSEIENSLGVNLLSSNLIKDSDAYKKVNEDIKTINVLCILIPGIVMLVSLGFSFIFIKIIVENQKSTIALLKSLGYSSKKVIGIFVLFTIIVNLLALLIGAPLGYLVLKLCVSLIVKADGILTVALTFGALPTIGLILLVFLIGIFASLFTAKSISKVDPSMIKSQNSDNGEAPKLAKNIRCHPFVKISLVSTLKNWKRLLIGIFCIGFCIISIAVGLEGVLTNAYHADAVYGERFKYDLMVRDIDEANYNDIKENVSGIKIIEPVTLFTTTVNDSTVNVSSIPENSELISLNDKDGNIIKPGNGVVIDEMYSIINKVNIGDTITLGDNQIKVTGIARELMSNYFYISEQTATNVYFKSTNCTYIKVINNEDIETIKKSIAAINPDSYFTLLSLQNQNLANRSKTMQLVMFILAMLSFAMGSLFVFNMAIIDFNEKNTKYATLRALGAPIDKICIVSLIENALRLLFGIIIALPITYFLCDIILGLLSNQYRQYVFVNYWGCFFVAVGISLFYILISYLVSRRKIRKMDLLEKLNEVEWLLCLKQYGLTICLSNY